MESEGNQSHWIPLADLMTGLMMIFMLLTAAFMLKVEQSTMSKIKIEEPKTDTVVKQHELTKQKLQIALGDEFGASLQSWNAEFAGDLTIRFKDPNSLFATGKSDLTDRYKEQLRDFFPRYVRILNDQSFKDVVKEVRIEGHTSTQWSSASTAKDAYLKNMGLSQERTRSTLEYLMSLQEISDRTDWVIKRVTANGLSSSRADPNNETGTHNQRVEFRIVTTADERMSELAKQLNDKPR
jgi:outer membrane protein OmpA-like peptidoglycan-associated protein